MSELAYRKVLASLFATRRLGVDFGLERVAECLAAMSLPHKTLATIQVAGTNGKGSTCAFLAEVLARVGYRVAVFSSPHLLSLCERFRIDGEQVSRTALVRAYVHVEPYCKGLTFFEQMTALAAYLFAEAKVEVAIYEVGLGGRLDSTTAVPATLSVVTGIALEHCEFLGDTLEEIALEKAGIFRSGVPVVIGLGAPEQIRNLLCDQSPLSIRVGNEHRDCVPSDLGLRGSHQRDNAACAVAALDCLRASGLSIALAAQTEGLALARLSGRFELVGEQLWIDGAHNAQASEVLAREIAGQGPWTLVVGLSLTKDAASFLAPIVKHCECIVATQAKGDRSHGSEEVARAARMLGADQVIAEPDVTRALALARDRGTKVLVTGSLILLGDALAALGMPGSDPLLVTDPGRRSGGYS